MIPCMGKANSLILLATNPKGYPYKDTYKKIIAEDT